MPLTVFWHNMLKDDRGDIMRQLTRLFLVAIAVAMSLVVAVVFQGCNKRPISPHILNVGASTKECNCSVDLILYTGQKDNYKVDVFDLK